MPHYLVQATYTRESWAAQVTEPKDVRDRIRPAIESLGGSLEGFYYTFGEDDMIAILQFPDAITAAGFGIAASSSAASFKMPPMMTVEEGMEAMKVARSSGYRPPVNA